MANNDSKRICVSRSVWFAKPEKTDKPVLESCRKAVILAFSWEIHGRLEYSCFGLVSDEGGDIHGVIKLIRIGLMKNSADIKLFDSFYKQNFIRFRNQTEILFFFFCTGLWVGVFFVSINTISRTYQSSSANMHMPYLAEYQAASTLSNNKIHSSMPRSPLNTHSWCWCLAL